MNPYGNPSLNINMNSGATDEELAAMQLAAMQDYLDKERNYNDLNSQGFGSGAKTLGTVGGAALGGLSGVGLSRLFPGPGRSLLYGLGGGVLGAIAGNKGVDYLGEKMYPGLREATENARGDYYNASNYLENAGDLDPRLYERVRLINRLTDIPQHPVISSEKEYNEMLARQKAAEIANMQLDQKLKQQEYETNKRAERDAKMQSTQKLISGAASGIGDILGALSSMNRQASSNNSDQLMDYAKELDKRASYGNSKMKTIHSSPMKNKNAQEAKDKIYPSGYTKKKEDNSYSDKLQNFLANRKKMEGK